MEQELVEAVERAEVGPFGPEILEALDIIDRLQCKVSDAIATFGAEGSWALDGTTSATAWLAYFGRMSRTRAAALARRAERLRELPVTKAAWEDGSLAEDQVGAIVANTSRQSVSLFAEHEASVVPHLVPLNVAQTSVAMRLWRLRAEATADRPDTNDDERSLHLSTTYDGRGELSGSLDPEANAVIAAAIRRATTPDAEGESRTAATRRADALLDICQRSLDAEGRGNGVRHRPHVNVVVRLSDLVDHVPGGQVVGGPLLSTTTIARLACDSALHRVIIDGNSSILDYGTAVRTTSVALFNALVLRDQHCRHPGCDRPPEWCEAHHVVPVERSGPTRLANLVLKCTRHHHLAHKPGWSEAIEPDGTLTIADPMGRIWRTHPPGVVAGLDLDLLVSA